MDVGRSVDKYLEGDLFPNIVIHNTLSICGRVAGWGTRDSERVLRLHRLVGSCVFNIVGRLGRFMRRARWWACAGSGPIE